MVFDDLRDLYEPGEKEYSAKEMLYIADEAAIEEVNLRYTTEEKLKLADMLEEVNLSNRHSKQIRDVSPEYMLTPYSLSRDEFDRLFEPLEDMPTHLEDRHIDHRTVAIWRLLLFK